jgi:hypothetical protein
MAAIQVALDPCIRGLGMAPCNVAASGVRRTVSGVGGVCALGGLIAYRAVGQ